MGHSLDNVIWRKSSYSGSNGGNCVEIAVLNRGLAVRDSKNPDGPKLTFGRPQWQAFITSAKTGRLDLG